VLTLVAGYDKKSVGYSGKRSRYNPGLGLLVRDYINGVLELHL
jgi:hypothetical protein